MCSHLEQVASPGRQPVAPGTPGCQECLEGGEAWVHLRLCLTCGHVGCCDSSPNRHATGHFHRTKHPVIKSFEPGERWAWCYVDGETLDSIAALPGESPPRHHGPPGEPG